MEAYLGTEEYKKAVEEYLAKAKFNCDFRDNQCIAQRIDGSPLATEEVPCCCGHCARATGYLEDSLIYLGEDEFWIEHYKDKFDSQLGFYRKGTGCILEREFRSLICNRYMCGFLRSSMFRGEEEELALAYHTLGVIVTRINMTDKSYQDYWSRR